MFLNYSIFVFLLAVIPFVILFLRPRQPLPPGPKPLPFIGNFHQLPRRNPYEVYHQWSLVHGPVMYFRVFNREFVILDSLKAITDLFEKRSSRYSTRPRLVMAGVLVGKEDTAILFMKYGTKWKQTRQLVHGWLNQRNLESYLPAQMEQSRHLLSDLLNDPQKFSEHLRTSIGSVILQLTYGIQCNRQQDPWIAKSEQLHQITALASQPGRWLVDSFPILRFIPPYFPGAYFRRWARQSRKVAFDLVRSPYERSKEEINNHAIRSSFVHDRLVEKAGRMTPEEEEALIAASGSLYAAGIDTLVSVMRTFFLVMVRYPEVQKRLQSEIDSVVGAHRLCEMDDRDSLPYVECVIKELLRFSAVAPLVPHSIEEDDIYDGYRIPKGAWIMANLWAVFNDPAIYYDPSSFKPGRFDPASSQPVEMDPTPLAFCVGLGRRFCPASYFSLCSLFINITHIVSVFNILPPLDANGEEVVPPFEFDTGHIRSLKPFECRILPRSADVTGLIESSLARAT